MLSVEWKGTHMQTHCSGPVIMFSIRNEGKLSVGIFCATRYRGAGPSLLYSVGNEREVIYIGLLHQVTYLNDILKTVLTTLRQCSFFGKRTFPQPCERSELQLITRKPANTLN